MSHISPILKVLTGLVGYISQPTSTNHMDFGAKTSELFFFKGTIPRHWLPTRVQPPETPFASVKSWGLAMCCIPIWKVITNRGPCKKPTQSINRLFMGETLSKSSIHLHWKWSPPSLGGLDLPWSKVSVPLRSYETPNPENPNGWRIP